MTPPIATSALPDPYRILGLRLLPLSLGRYRLLQRFGCAFVSDTESSATVEDLLLGLVICSMRVREFVGWIQVTPGWFKDGIKWPWHTRGAGADLRAWGRRIKREVKKDASFDLTSKCKLFNLFLETSCQIPQAFNNHDGDQSGAHWSHAIEVALRSKVGWTQMEIEESPLSKAIADYFRWAEQEGLITLMRPEDIEAGEQNSAALDSMVAAIEARKERCGA